MFYRPKKKDPNKKSVIVECECSTHYLQLTAYEGDNSIYFTFLEDKFYSQQDGILRTIVTRIKLAWKMLTGKRYQLEEIIIDKKDIQELVNSIIEMEAHLN